MPAALDQPLEDQPIVAEGHRGFAPRGSQPVGQAARLADDAHPLAAAARRRLDQEREADAFGGRGQRRVGLVGVVIADEDRDSERGRKPPRRRLVAHRPDGTGWWTHPDEPRSLDRLGEACVFGQEAEAGMDRVRTGGAGGRRRPRRRRGGRPRRVRRSAGRRP